MTSREPGPAGDVDYERAGVGYAGQRRADPRIAAYLHPELAAAGSVLNIGAGSGSYEPTDREVTAVEPSATMRAQRPVHLAAAIDAVAEHLPFPDDSFDAAMAVITVHQWRDLERGLRELRRVARGPVLILTFDPDLIERFWLSEYAPSLLASEARRFPSIDRLITALGGSTSVTSVPVPLDCTDGFLEAYHGRPEAFLDPTVRRSQSAWELVDPDTVDQAMARLHDDLAQGAWDRRHGTLRARTELNGSLRLITNRPSAGQDPKSPW